MKNFIKSDQRATPQHKKSKFVVDTSVFGIFQLVFGKLLAKDGQLWSGEKMQFCGNTNEPDFPTPYWGW